MLKLLSLAIFMDFMSKKKTKKKDKSMALIGNGFVIELIYSHEKYRVLMSYPIVTMLK